MKNFKLLVLIFLLVSGNVFADIDGIYLSKLTRAANRGNVVAQFQLGEIFRSKPNAKDSDLKKSFAWHYRAAVSGNSHQSQYLLGLMYATGKGVMRDYDKAFIWFGKSAGQNNAKAKYNLGTMYAYGKGVEQDFERAFFWKKSAAKSGYAIAQYRLGIDYLYGYHSIIDIDKNLSYAWFNLANTNGFDGAREFLDTLEHKFSFEEISAAQKINPLTQN